MAVDGSLYHTEVINEHGLTGQSYVRGNEGLALGVSSSLLNSPGTNPEQFIGFALSTCFNATIGIVERQHNIEPDSIVHTGVDIVKDTKGYKFIVQAQIFFNKLDNDQGQQMVDEALDQCPVAKLLKANENVTFEVVDKFTL
ncbi:OsmC family peroxiredoxin [Lentilactobacillus parafarraginis]|uniref:OsmC-like protein n=3 Tax=Lentilactobacillus parafarraginis TaxID=390842 RepID=A0A0R1YV48_9LACO|nr:OsmC family protein [Lentilactobacillus parafarraginis]KRM43707.1 OsmC-like protein [Lentilactobacillus parafarraginis DSM 18390 = JCM 14109]TLQ16642.1 OsmC family peroxiredoxin [Lentilactobacillus parafarraginis]